MSISCGCEDYCDVCTVGDPREVICRTPRQCSCCHADIKILDAMYMWSMFDFSMAQTCSPCFLCEECGDMSLNLMKVGYCFDLGTGIKNQWLDYLHDTEPNNPALKKEPTNGNPTP